VMASNGRFSTVPIFSPNRGVQVVAVADPVSDLPHYGYQGEKRGGRLVGTSALSSSITRSSSRAARSRAAAPTRIFARCSRARTSMPFTLPRPITGTAPSALHAVRHGKPHLWTKTPRRNVGGGPPHRPRSRRYRHYMAKRARSSAARSFRSHAMLVRKTAAWVDSSASSRLRRRTQRQVWPRRAQAPSPLPPELNWDLWLGPAPKQRLRARAPAAHLAANFDFSAVQFSPTGVRTTRHSSMALGTDDTGPIAIENVEATVPLRPTFTTPRRRIRSSGLRQRHRAPTRPATRRYRFRGRGGKSIFVTRGVLESNPTTSAAKKIGPARSASTKAIFRRAISSTASATPSPPSHLRSGPPLEHHRDLANIAIRLGRSRLQWEPAAEKIRNDSRVHRLCSRARSPRIRRVSLGRFPFVSMSVTPPTCFLVASSFMRLPWAVRL